MSRQLKITYLDGSELVVTRTGRSMVDAERHFGEKIPALESALYVAWLQAKPGIGFEEWLDTVEDVNEVKPDPTEAPPSEGSPDSQ